MKDSGSGFPNISGAWDSIGVAQGLRFPKISEFENRIGYVWG